MITQTSTPLRKSVPRNPLRLVPRTEMDRPRGPKENWQPVGNVVSGILRSIARPNDKPVS